MKVISSAPGRIDFLNTHQDYKGLPTVPIAIDRRVSMEGKNRDDSLFSLASRDISGGEDLFPVERPEYAKKPWWGNYLRAVVNALTAAYPKKLMGLDVVVESNLPIASGLASSAALEVAFASLLNCANGLRLGPRDVAEVCYRAEHYELGIPCGRLDQYSSAFGGVIFLESRPPYAVEELPRIPASMVIIDSGVKHSTGLIHPVRQAELDEGLSQLFEAGDVDDGVARQSAPKYDEVLWERMNIAALGHFLPSINPTYSKRVLFTVLMQRSTVLAVKLMKSQEMDLGALTAVLGDNLRKPRDPLEALGQIVNYQHELLRDLYEVSHPQLELLRDLALSSGAIGAKLSGAGMGGAVLAIARDEATAKRCVEAVSGEAALASVVSVDLGASSRLLP
jgi:galactokinase